MSETPIKLGKKVKKLRVEAGYSQEQLAFKCGLHRTYISDIERGTRNISLKNLEKLAKALEVSVSKLLDF